MKKLAVLLMFAGLTAVVTGTASAESLSTLTYNMSVPFGDTKDFADSTSFQGVEFNYRHFVSERFAIGGSVGWNVFDEEVSELITIRTEDFNGEITGTQFRYINSFPLLVTAHFHLGNVDGAHVYVGGRAGVYYMKQRLELGQMAFAANEWQFGVVPEIGFIAPMGDSSSFIANIQYNFPFSSGEFLGGESRSFQYVGFNVGIAFGAY